MIIKQVKEYGTKTKRQRIDLAKADGFTPGEDVVIISKEKYDSIKQDILELSKLVNKKDKDIEIYKNRIEILSNQEEKHELNLKEIIQNSVTPIKEHYQKELENKDNQIKQLEIKYNSLQGKAHKNNLELMGLNLFEILIQKKFKNLIMEFDQELTIIATDPEIVTATAKKIPSSDEK